MKELAILFLKLGTIAFGGPAAHISLMEDEVVRKRAWFSQQEFLDLLGAANLLPGPSSTELAIFIGYKRAGFRGLVLAGTCFIFPAMVMVWAIAKLYVQMGTLPAVSGVLYGIKAVIVAIIVQAILSLGRAAVKTVSLGVIGLGALILFILGANTLLVFILGGLISLVIDRSILSFKKSKISVGSVWIAIWTLSATVTAAAAAAETQKALHAVPLTRIFLFFVKLGSVVFGSGYVLLAFLQNELVNQRHWLTQTQLLDAIAVGQFTPGPVFTTATFIGYILRGNQGALLATVGIFMPAFVWVALSGHIIPRIRNSQKAKSFLNGINVTSLALMTFVALQLGKAALINVPSLLMSISSLILLQKYRINSVWLILLGGAIGVAIFRSSISIIH